MKIFMKHLTLSTIAISLSGVIHGAEASHDPFLRGSERELASNRIYCRNTADGTQIDFGCIKAYPLCADAKGDDLKDSTATGICFKCLNDGSGKDHIDLGCSSARARCDSVAGKYGFNCLAMGSNIKDLPLPCTETSPDGKDSGCTADEPFCGTPSGLPTTSAGHCFKCQNNKADNNTVDNGCSEDFPACDAIPLSYGTKCVSISRKSCTNTATGDKQDSGCTSAYPMCADAEGAPLENSSTKGVCYRCLNDGSGSNHIDLGCIPSRPRCNALEGYHGYGCITRV